jgi:Flp pilus assembly protein TadB
MLTPLFIIIPVSWLLLGHRRAMHKIGSYLQAFYDERALGTRWETRVEAFRQQVERSHTLDAVPGLLWAVSILCAVAFGYVCYRLHGPLYVLLFLLVPAMALLWFHIDWRGCVSKDREQFLDEWHRIRGAEKAARPNAGSF